MTVRKILVGFDGSRSARSALDCAVALAARHKARVLGMVIEDERRFVKLSFLESIAVSTGLTPNIPSPLPPVEMFDAIERIEQESSELEAQFYAALRQQNLEGEFLIERSNVAASLTKHGNGADLICLGRSGAHVGLPKVQPGSSLHAVAKNCSSPILATAAMTSQLNSIFVAFDGSDASHRALRASIELLAGPHSKIFLATIASTPTEVERIQTPALEYLSETKTHFESLSASGNPSDELLHLISTISPEVVAVGAFSSGLLREVLKGSTTEAVLSETKNAILLAH